MILNIIIALFVALAPVEGSRISCLQDTCCCGDSVAYFSDQNQAEGFITIYIVTITDSNHVQFYIYETFYDEYYGDAVKEISRQDLIQAAFKKNPNRFSEQIIDLKRCDESEIEFVTDEIVLNYKDENGENKQGKAGYHYHFKGKRIGDVINVTLEEIQPGYQFKHDYIFKRIKLDL